MQGPQESAIFAVMPKEGRYLQTRDDLAQGRSSIDHHTVVGEAFVVPRCCD